MSRTVHLERHRTGRIGWLRAAVLGANDGIVSTASLIVGVAAANAGRTEMLVAGVAGLVAGAMSMAAGEYVSVSSQADTEQADVARERDELAAQPDLERRELAAIYVARGLTSELATQVAEQLTAHDALGAHSRDELGRVRRRERAPRASRPDVGRKFRGRRRIASAHVVRRTGVTSGRRRGWHILGVSHRARCGVGAHGWSASAQGFDARGVLGGAGDGRYCRRRPALRYSGLKT